MKKTSKNKGFTLIELIVVFAIISLLSAVVAQSLSSTRAKSRDAVRLQNIESIAKGFQVATTGNTNQFPTSVNAYVCLGISSGTCWAAAPPYSFNTIVNGILEAGLSGKIPLDPLYTIGQDGGVYLYNSNDTVGGVQGAYLYWKMESLNSCGRGITTGSQLCKLYLGPPVP